MEPAATEKVRSLVRNGREWCEPEMMMWAWTCCRGLMREPA